jgi:hypothetical protein
MLFMSILRVCMSKVIASFSIFITFDMRYPQFAPNIVFHVKHTIVF